LSPEGTESEDCPQCVHIHRPKQTIQVLTQDISILSQTLAAMQATQSAESTVAQSDVVIEAAHSAKYSLTAAIVAMQGNTALPNLDVIARNHKLWMETAKQMGATKSKRLHPAEDSGLTAWCIGVVKGKRRCIHNDPYAGEERSGKHVKRKAPSPANAAPPTVESTPSITLPGPVTVPPPTGAPGIVPLGVAIPAQGDAFVYPPVSAPRIAPLGIPIPAQGDALVHPPTRTPRITPSGPLFTMLLQALAFYTAAPPSVVDGVRDIKFSKFKVEVPTSESHDKTST
jgi:hypothetical protein